MLVGNKTDLRFNEVSARTNQEFVKLEDIREMGEKICAYSYVECSAKLNRRVWQVFQTAARAMQTKRKDNRSCIIS